MYDACGRFPGKHQDDLSEIGIRESGHGKWVAPRYEPERITLLAFGMSGVYLSRMKTVCLLLSALLVVAGARSQTSVEKEPHAGNDTSRIILVEPGMSSGSALFLLPPHLEQPLLFDSPTYFFGALPPSTSVWDPGRPLEIRPDLLAPLRLQWQREAQLGTFRAILGSIQIGGVAYLAYRHFAKSGPMTVRPRTSKTSRK